METQISVYPTDVIISQACSLWGCSSNAILLDDITNFVYETKLGLERKIIRLTHSVHHSEEEVIAELDWVLYLSKHGIPACKPTLSRKKRFTEIIEYNRSYFTVASFEYAAGHEVDESDPNDWNSTFFHNYGRIFGRMHKLTKEYNPTHLKIKRSHWTEDNLICKALEYLPKEDQAVAYHLNEWIATINKNIPTKDHYGLIHADLNPTNFHIQNNELSIFDFDDCAFGWFINDIAVAMPLYNKFLFSDNWELPFKNYLKEFMNGYKLENNIDPNWIELLPICLRIQNAITLVAMYQMNIPGSKYHSFFELVNTVYKNGHHLFDYDFRTLHE